MNSDTPALNADGSLKSAKDMELDHSPSSSVAALPRPPDLLSVRPITFIEVQPGESSSKGKKRSGLDNINDISTKKKPHITTSVQTRKVAPKVKATLRPATEHLLLPQPSAAASETILGTPQAPANASTSTATESSALNVNEIVAVAKKAHKKGNVVADISTICTLVPRDDGSKHALKKSNHVKFGKLQTMFKGNHSTMRTHIARQGMSHYNVYQERQSSILQYAEVKEKSVKWSKEGLEENILQFVVETDQALNITEHASFRGLLQYQHRKSTDKDIPKHTYVTTRIIGHAAEIQKELAKKLQDAPGRVSLTFDGWTSAIMRAYLAVIVHYITDDWKLWTELLAFSELEVNNKGMCTLEVQLKNDKIAFDAKEQRSHCFSHAVNLDGEVVADEDETKDDVEVLVKEVEATIAALPPNLKGSTTIAALLLSLIIKAVISFVSLADDSDEVPNVDKDQRGYSYYRLLSEDWNHVQLITEVLHAASLVQELFSSETVPCVWRILSGYEKFIVTWQEMAKRADMYALKEAILIGVITLEKYYNKTDNSSAHIVKLYLNPCIKNEYFIAFWDSDGQVHAQTVMEAVFDKYSVKHVSLNRSSASQGTIVVPVPASRSYGSSWLATATAGRRAHEKDMVRDPRAELKQYLDEDLLSLEGGNLTGIPQWWKVNGTHFPILSSMAWDYLAIQGSSVPLLQQDDTSDV
ncbi:hypothetical protein SCP_0103770 [Sparassis crispa]|uniref:HAT C-terminal dimerisation domain-containing protein n=1 Tax=Sparassis crispa TaxID=139825 RepID=A0A401G5R1_9APHY|nr:hypothetical protein SCP_0103770 [Sparassis crispa]GBE77502.1 hypothetical protein SCP_0103770 [Sparassis crispa]